VSNGNQTECQCTKGHIGKRCELLVFEGLGVLDVESLALGVSDDGATVVGSSGKSAIAWTASAGIHGLEGVTGYNCKAIGVSGDAAVPVGTCLGSGTKARPVRWVQGKVEDLDAQGTGSEWVTGVNSDGSVVVGYFVGTATTQTRAFRWTASSGVVEIPMLVSGQDTYAFATTRDGSTVVGQSGTAGFRWSIGSNPQSLGTRDSTALGVNADGSVIVGQMPNDGGNAHAFRWTQAEGLVDLGVLSSDLETHAYDVNADGSVIVGESGPEEQGEALLWTKSGGLQPLKTVLANSGADLTGWTVGTATSVSSNGKVIVGYGTHNGHTEGWIARLP
jgi:probable HAF family extracellular repeat protein